jgi:hypothetical protein
MNEMHDDELRSRFAELRSSDAARAPDFHGVLERASRRATRVERNNRRWLSPVAVSLAAAAAIVLTIGLTMRSRQRRAFVPVTLSIWTSPTASLLRTPGAELVTSPTLVPSIVDPMTSATLSRRGNKK